MARALIHMPEAARRGEVIEIRALIGHPMETGYRPGADGRVLPPVPVPPALPAEPAAALMDRNRADGISPGPWTPTPDWHGESLDLGFALDVLRR